MTTRLIELFAEKRVLWDSTITDRFKDRLKKHDAWAELGADMGMDPMLVEKKVRMLIGQFNRELRKGKSGIGADAQYKSKWSFFKRLLFLKDKYEPCHSIEAGFSHASFNQDIAQALKDNNFSIFTENERQSLDELKLETQANSGNCQQPTVDTNIPCKSVKRSKRKMDAISEENSAIAKWLSDKVDNRDAFDVFGEHVANTLRNLKSRSIQCTAKFEISSILYRAEINDHKKTSIGASDPGTLSGDSTPISLDVTPVLSNQSSYTEQNDGPASDFVDVVMKVEHD